MLNSFQLKDLLRCIFGYDFEAVNKGALVAPCSRYESLYFEQILVTRKLIYILLLMFRYPVLSVLSKNSHNILLGSNLPSN